MDCLFFFCYFIFFLIFILFYFLTLQYCIGFAIYQNESSTGIHVFPILNPPPSSLPTPSLQSSQCTSPKHPVSCIKPGLATRFIHDILHVSMPFSQIIPPSPSPTPMLSMNIQDWFPLGLTGRISLQSKELSRVFSYTTVQKHQFFSAQLSSQSNPHIHT